MNDSDHESKKLLKDYIWDIVSIEGTHRTLSRRISSIQTSKISPESMSSSEGQNLDVIRTLSVTRCVLGEQEYEKRGQPARTDLVGSSQCVRHQMTKAPCAVLLHTYFFCTLQSAICMETSDTNNNTYDRAFRCPFDAAWRRCGYNVHPQFVGCAISVVCTPTGHDLTIVNLRVDDVTMILFRTWLYQPTEPRLHLDLFINGVEDDFC